MGLTLRRYPTWIVLSLAFLHFAAVAMQILHLSPAEISPNLWYLAPNPASKAFSTAYPYLMGVMFLASFPFTILARTISTSAVALLCCSQPSAGKQIPLSSLTRDLHPHCLVKGGGVRGRQEGVSLKQYLHNSFSLFKLLSRCACVPVACLLHGCSSGVA